jgi:hypothetical protein
LVVTAGAVEEKVEFFVGAKTERAFEFRLLFSPPKKVLFADPRVLFGVPAILQVWALLKVLPFWRIERVRKAAMAVGARASLDAAFVDGWTRVRYAPTWLLIVTVVYATAWVCVPVTFAHVGIEQCFLCVIFFWGFVADGQVRVEATPAYWLLQHFLMSILPFINLVATSFDPRRNWVGSVRTVVDVALIAYETYNLASAICQTDPLFSLLSSPLFWASCVITVTACCLALCSFVAELRLHSRHFERLAN